MASASAASKPRTRTDYDGGWKFAVERFFVYFMAFFYPRVHADIDWARGFEFLEQELRRMSRRAPLGRHTVDKLVRVWMRDGHECWLLIHIEIQCQVDDNFDHRMFVYFLRLFTGYGAKIASFAILADPDPNWRPRGFYYARWSTSVRFEYEPVKLLDYWNQMPALQASNNPFAAIVEVHLRTLATRRRPKIRLEAKVALLRGLYQRGFSREDVEDLIQFLDWLMVLPARYESTFDFAVKSLEEERKMPVVSRMERRWTQRAFETAKETLRDEVTEQVHRELIPAIIEKVRGEVREEVREALYQEWRDSIASILSARFGNGHIAVDEELRGIDDLGALRILTTAAATEGSLQGFLETLRGLASRRGGKNGEE